MKLSLWVSHGLCVAIGIGATLLVLRSGDSGSAHSSATFPFLQAQPTEPPNTMARPYTERQSTPAPLATLARSSAPPSAAEADLINGAATYAASFQSGVFGSEPMPDFATNHIFASESDRATEREQEMEFAQETMDGWAADMERRLQLFFQDQPELSQVRVSVTCKTSQCQVQIVERAGEGRLSGTLGTRLYNEPWYKENFHPVGIRGATPSGVGEVHYARLLLRRRL